MTSKRVQDLLEANHRYLERAREAEEKLTQAPEEAKKRLEAIRLITMLKDATGVLIQAAGQPGQNLEYEINSLLVSLAGKFERFIGLPKTEDEAKSMISVGLAYLNGMGGDYEERVIMMPRDEYEREIREAFQAGWRTNAEPDTAENAAQVAESIDVDFEAYQDLGITIYLDQLQPIKEEFGTQEDPKSWADKWASKVDELAQQPADNDSAVVNTMPEEIDGQRVPLNPGEILYTNDGAVQFTSATELAASHLQLGPVRVDLKTGEVNIQEDITIEYASRLFWRGVEEHVLHREPLPRVIHVKRGTTYEVLGDGEAQISVPQVVMNFASDHIDNARILKEGMKLRVYRAEEDGKLWLRFPDEFDDGRFETIR